MSKRMKVSALGFHGARMNFCIFDDRFFFFFCCFSDPARHNDCAHGFRTRKYCFFILFSSFFLGEWNEAQ